MAVKPLKELLKEVDDFDRVHGQLKTASPKAASVTDDIASFADDLMGAKTIEINDAGFEKTAMAMNRAEALIQIKTLEKIAEFRTRAAKAGYTEQQIDEAVEKIAAKKLKENLGVLTATNSIVTPMGKDKNSLEMKKRPAKEIAQGLENKDLTTTMGYGT
jgi:hypothetical protein